MSRQIIKRESFYRDSNYAEWADPEDLKKISTLTKIHLTEKECNATGFPIISDGYTAYVDNSDTHTLIFGNTGSKKTRLFGMPLINIFALGGESFIVTDPKGELYAKTSGFVASKGYKPIVLNFRTMTQSAMWNPLLIPYQLYHNGEVDEAISMLNDFLSVLAAPQRKGKQDPYWIDLGYSLALSLMLFFIETATMEEANINSFINFFATYSSPENAEKIAKVMVEGSVASLNIKAVMTTVSAEKTFGNIASTAASMFNQFIIQKSLCQLLSKSSIDLRQIGKEKSAVYIIVPDEKDTLHFMVSIFVKQIYEILISEAQKENKKRLPVRLNFLLDEFGNIPTIPNMPSMITAARSRNIRFFLMTQGIFQLNKKYKNEVETFIGNCDNLVFLSSKEPALLKMISDLCGYTNKERIEDGITSKEPLITTFGLQSLSKEWDKSEVLIKHCRELPFMSVLPDIDWYGFETYPPIDMDNTVLPEITLYNAANVLSEIYDHKRPLPFSMEVYGEAKFYEGPKIDADFYDW